MEKATFIQCLFNVVLYLNIIGIIFPLYNRPHVNLVVLKRKYSRLMLLAFLVCTFPFWAGDYFHMKQDYLLARQGETSNWEQIYQWLSLLLPSYSVLRIVIWGGALYLVHNLFKTLYKESVSLGMGCVLFFMAMCLPNYSYLRAASCMSMIYFGVSLLIVNQDDSRSTKTTVIAFILIAASFFFHKSAIIAIGVLILSFFSVQVKNMKVLLLFAIIITPYAIGYGNAWIQDFILTSPLEESSINIYAAQSYFDEQLELGSSGPGILVQNFLSRMQYYLVLLLYVLILFKGNYKHLPYYIKFFANFSIITIVLANITQIALDVTSYVFYYRILYYSMIPSAIFLSYCFSQGYYTKICKLTFYIAILGSLYTFVYSTYNTL